MKYMIGIDGGGTKTEAIAFAILANETYHRNPSNVPSATGARNCSFRECNVHPQYEEMRRTYMKYMIGIDGGGNEDRSNRLCHFSKRNVSS